jgi:predicted phosphodiesterase
MRLALISDLHGNALALEAVLADARRVGFDRLVCLGDVATLGPRPAEVLGRLRELQCACILGNHDEFMLRPELVEAYSRVPVVVQSVHATRAALSAADVAFIRTFVPTVALDDGVFLFHGTPRSNTEDLLATTPAADVDAMLGGRKAMLFAGGHTHVQMLRQHRGMLVVNCGSLGQPFQEFAFNGPPIVLPHAEYAIVDVRAGNASVDLRRVALDKAGLGAQVDGWDNPLAGFLRAMYA